MNPASLDQQLIPALENGDRLSRAEFERRYNLMPDLKKAEFGYTGTVAGRDVASSDSPVLTVLQEGLGSPEHQAFVAQLSRASAVTICVN